jgi:tRNA uridine 5-carboxymethylaminomethyl modification enzyme
MMRFDEIFDVIVIGGGHAGCEAASASARLGSATALVTMNLDLIGQMSCNPAIGGIAKGHLVREIDALGGIMGRVADRSGIHFRLLNRSRGPAVRSPRAQTDRSLYRKEMRLTLEQTQNLSLRQGTVVDLLVKQNEIQGVELLDGRKLGAGSVVIATGTFLNGRIHTGPRSYSAGRAGEPASIELAEALKRLSFPVGRLKTGTPPRLDGRTIDWDAFEVQSPDVRAVPFSFATDQIDQPQLDCFVGYTTTAIHELIRKNLTKSPLYSGKITGIGPRYCPSIEDKVVKFASKDRHQLFLEPEGHNTNEVYVNGFSTSLPPDLQQDLIRLVPGLGGACMIRPGYAIEYDFVDPRELGPDLQTRRLPGLFNAGQINGTTGYEEAACQGLIAGINAALRSQGRKSFRVRRDEAYIGVLIEDLITQGVDEPYRVFTSRAENRLLLRYDNADARLEPSGRELGLVGDTDWERYNLRSYRISELRRVMRETRFRRSDPSYLAAALAVGSDLGDSISLEQLSRRAGVGPDVISSLISEKVDAVGAELESVMADVLYEGYIENHRSQLERLHSHDGLKIPSQFDFRSLGGLSTEMVERLERAQPITFGDARRINGITTAGLTALLVSLKCQSRSNSFT